jgi:carbon storage regulator CsrA
MAQRIKSPGKISVVCSFPANVGAEASLKSLISNPHGRKIMLVLSRKEDQSIVFPNLGISIEIVRVQGNKVSVGVEAPKAFRVVRGELQSNASSNEHSCNFQLGQIIEVLSPETRNELSDRLRVAERAVHAAQKQCELGGLENAEFFLRQAVEALAQLNQMFDLPQVVVPSDCVKENQTSYGLTAGVSDRSSCSNSNDRGIRRWFSKPAVSQQVLEYLQHALCSNN